MKTIVFFTRSEYPNGDANAVRQHALANTYMLCGYNVRVVVFGELDTEWVEYEKVSFCHVSKSYIDTFLGKLSKGDVSAFMLNDISDLPVMFKIKRYALKNQIKLVHDAVEWYSKEQFEKGFFSRTYLRKEFVNRFFLDKNFNIISISRFFEDYYMKRNIRTVRIPVVMDVLETGVYNIKREDDKVCIVYVGSPGGLGCKKDYFEEILEGLDGLPAELQSRIELNIVGLKENDVNHDTKKSVDVKYWGRISREQALEIYKRADFSILLRPNARYTRAGFPTKIIESLTNGVPVITNLTSDLQLYLKNEDNSILIEECSSNGVNNALLKVLDLSDEKKKQMKKNARSSAETFFDYRIYVDKIRNLMGDDIDDTKI